MLSSFGVGGQERVALDLASAQVAAGHRVLAVSLAAPPEGALASLFRARGIRVATLAKARGVDPALTAYLAGHFLRRSVDVVHTHNPQPLIYGAPAARFAGAAAVHTKHGANPDRGPSLALRRAAGHLAHAYVAVSSTTAEVARRNRECPPSRLHTIHNGIDVRSFAPDPDARAAVRAELGLPGDAWVIGTVGRLSPEKNQTLLVRAAGPLLSPSVRLVIVGDGTERDRVRAAAARFAPFVALTGMRSDVARVLAAFDVFALSSDTEGLPLVLPEAMAVGVPVVATSVGGVGEVVAHERTGLLVEPRDQGALAASLRRLIDDPSLARSLATAGAVAARASFSAETMVARYEELYRACLARR